jgi:threonine dehydratase
MTQTIVNLNDIKKAQETIKPVARRTPLIQSYYFSSLTGGQVFLKLEDLQLTGSFKFRGAYNKISSLTDEQKSVGVIACSAGNHAQGVALSAKLQGISATIVMPKTAPQAKVDATRSYGAEVILAGDTFDECKEECIKLIEVTGKTFLHPYDDQYVIAGQGTVGLEIMEDLADVDTIIVPIGGGGLISGVAIAAKTLNPNIKIIGVQADNVHGMKASFDAGKITRHFVAATMADGCAVAIPGDLTFEITKELVDDIVTVSEAEIELSFKDLLQRGKVIVEGSGALATAAIHSGKIDQYIKGKKVAAVLSGGNVDLVRVSNICDYFTGREMPNTIK